MKLSTPPFCLPEIFSKIELGIEAGVAHASWMLGNAYYLGTIGTQDFQKAATYYKVAHEQGSFLAGHSLGTLFEQGIGVERDFAMAFEYFKSNADRGHTNAQRKTALAYLWGLGVSKNELKAEEYFTLAAINSCSESDWLLQVFDALGSYPLANRGETLLHLRREAEAGNTKAMRALGLAREYAIGYTRVNFKLAIEWYRKATDCGCPRATCDYANMILNGDFTDKEKMEAIEFLIKATESGLLEAKHLLAVALFTGNGTPKMIVLAEKYFRELMDANYLPAAANIANFLLIDSPSDALLLRVAAFLKSAYKAGINCGREGLIQLPSRFPTFFPQTEESLLLLEIEASLSDENAVTELARIYLDDSRSDQLDLLNGKRGLFWLQVGVCDLSARAMDILAWELMRGRHIAAEQASALALLSSAASMGYEEAAFGLAYYHATDPKVITNKEFTVKMYEAAAAAGSKSARVNLAQHVHHGDGVNADHLLADALVQKDVLEKIADSHSRNESILTFDSTPTPLKNGGKILNFPERTWPTSKKSS